MLHRTTWMTIPVVGLVILGSGLGWWGYDQYRQRQAMATQAQKLEIESDNQYSANFHGLVDSMQHLRDELGKAIVTGDQGAFQQRMADIWRLSYAAQTDIGLLPFDLMPMHQTQHYLTDVSNQTETWMKNNTSPTNGQVHGHLQQWYQQAQTLTGKLTALQTTVLQNGADWANVNKDIRTRHNDNQVIDGFRKIDTAASVFVESQDHPSSTQKGKTYALASQPTVTEATAKARFAQYVSGVTDVRVSRTKNGAYRPEYIIDGRTPQGTVHGTVAQNGGHVLSFDIARFPSKGNYDFAQARNNGQDWLKAHGFGDTEAIISNQYDHIGYFVFAPVRNHDLVMSQGIPVQVALDNGQVVGFDANDYYYYPVHSVPSRKYTSDQLRKKLNPSFHVGNERQVLALDDSHQYQPVTAFYGTANDETYCIYMNANTGREMDVEKLS